MVLPLVCCCWCVVVGVCDQYPENWPNRPKSVKSLGNWLSFVKLVGCVFTWRGVGDVQALTDRGGVASLAAFIACGSLVCLAGCVSGVVFRFVVFQLDLVAVCVLGGCAVGGFFAHAPAWAARRICCCCAGDTVGAPSWFRWADFFCEGCFQGSPAYFSKLCERSLRCWSLSKISGMRNHLSTFFSGICHLAPQSIV
ncbi:unnamed protein product [Amoebophrya sp. A25]|nr:unnamed protein product [Amoebophrya sp. A25]|eukprot:GSA25T00023633001.1